MKISDERLKELALLQPIVNVGGLSIDEKIYMARELELSRKVVKATLEAREHLWQEKYLKVVNDALDKLD